MDLSRTVTTHWTEQTSADHFDYLDEEDPMPIDLSPSKISDYDLAVLRSTYQAFGTRDCEWGKGAQAGMRAAAAILGVTIDEEDDQ